MNEYKKATTAYRRAKKAATHSKGEKSKAFHATQRKIKEAIRELDSMEWLD